jgi:hypothetical protein
VILFQEQKKIKKLDEMLENKKREYFLKQGKS